MNVLFVCVFYFILVWEVLAADSSAFNETKNISLFNQSRRTEKISSSTGDATIFHDENEQLLIRRQTLCPPMRYNCDDLPGYCLSCDFNTSCVYGSTVTVSCKPLNWVFCKVLSNKTDLGNNTKFHLDSNQTVPNSNISEHSIPPIDHTDYTVQKSMVCRYCHQLEDREIICLGRINCRKFNVPRSFYETRCEPLPSILCLGRRIFRRMVPCDWSSGKSYALTILLSLFFGGLGVDRFYLGMWIEGLGKLFSFGGLGVWSIVDFILIVAGYVKPPGDAVYW